MYQNQLKNDFVSVRKIPMVKKDITFSDEDNYDKIKILELNNKIDSWEQELLFSEKGFFTLKGKDVENKTEEFCNELQKFINSQVSLIKFKNPQSMSIVSKIKTAKIKAIKIQLKKYENEQLRQWKIQVCDEALKFAINRAVLYKNNLKIIQSSYKNAILILQFISDDEKWNDKIFNSKKVRFESDFYSAIINSFVKDKDVKAYIFFNEYKNKLHIKNKEEIQKNLENLKNKIVAYNWLNELVSYNLTEEENQKEINSVKDNEIKILIEKYFKYFQERKKLNELNQTNIKNEENWNEIVSLLNSEPDKAALYIDNSFDEKNQKLKSDYILQFQKNGFILSDKNKFVDLLNEIKDDFAKFKKKSISDYRSFLSDDDYNFLKNLREKNWDEYNFFVSEYEYLLSKLQKNISKTEIYNIYKLFLKSKSDYISANKKNPDIENVNKIINAVLERSLKYCESNNKKINKEKEEKDNSPKNKNNDVQKSKSEKDGSKGEIK